MLSVALTSFVTGITEPIEYSFLFIAPLLYAIHALLTGVSMAVTRGLGVHDGFSFPAGLIDHIIDWNLATKPVGDRPDRATLRRRLLRDLPFRDHEIRSEDAGPGAGRGARGRRQGVARGAVRGVAPGGPAVTGIAGSSCRLHRATTGLHH
jgi:hypothetical protein